MFAAHRSTASQSHDGDGSVRSSLSGQNTTLMTDKELIQFSVQHLDKALGFGAQPGFSSGGRFALDRQEVSSIEKTLIAYAVRPELYNTTVKSVAILVRSRVSAENDSFTHAHIDSPGSPISSSHPLFIAQQKILLLLRILISILDPHTIPQQEPDSDSLESCLRFAQLRDSYSIQSGIKSVRDAYQLPPAKEIKIPGPDQELTLEADVVTIILHIVYGVMVSQVTDSIIQGLVAPFMAVSRHIMRLVSRPDRQYLVVLDYITKHLSEPLEGVLSPQPMKLAPEKTTNPVTMIRTQIIAIMYMTEALSLSEARVRGVMRVFALLMPKFHTIEGQTPQTPNSQSQTAATPLARVKTAPAAPTPSTQGQSPAPVAQTEPMFVMAVQSLARMVMNWIEEDPDQYCALISTQAGNGVISQCEAVYSIVFTHFSHIVVDRLHKLPGYVAWVKSHDYATPAPLREVSLLPPHSTVISRSLIQNYIVHVYGALAALTALCPGVIGAFNSVPLDTAAVKDTAIIGESRDAATRTNAMVRWFILHVSRLLHAFETIPVGDRRKAVSECPLFPAAARAAIIFMRVQGAICRSSGSCSDNLPSFFFQPVNLAPEIMQLQYSGISLSDATERVLELSELAKSAGLMQDLSFYIRAALMYSEEFIDSLLPSFFKAGPSTHPWSQAAGLNCIRRLCSDQFSSPIPPGCPLLSLVGARGAMKPPVSDARALPMDTTRMDYYRPALVHDVMEQMTLLTATVGQLRPELMAKLLCHGQCDVTAQASNLVGVLASDPLLLLTFERGEPRGPRAGGAYMVERSTRMSLLRTRLDMLADLCVLFSPAARLGDFFQAEDVDWGSSVAAPFRVDYRYISPLLFVGLDDSCPNIAALLARRFVMSPSSALPFPSGAAQEFEHEAMAKSLRVLSCRSGFGNIAFESELAVAVIISWALSPRTVSSFWFSQDVEGPISPQSAGLDGFPLSAYTLIVTSVVARIARVIQPSHMHSLSSASLVTMLSLLADLHTALASVMRAMPDVKLSETVKKSCLQAIADVESAIFALPIHFDSSVLLSSRFFIRAFSDFLEIVRERGWDQALVPGLARATANHPLYREICALLEEKRVLGADEENDELHTEVVSLFGQRAVVTQGMRQAWSLSFAEFCQLEQRIAKDAASAQRHVSGWSRLVSNLASLATAAPTGDLSAAESTPSPMPFLSQLVRVSLSQGAAEIRIATVEALGRTLSTDSRVLRLLLHELIDRIARSKQPDIVVTDEQTVFVIHAVRLLSTFLDRGRRQHLEPLLDLREQLQELLLLLVSYISLTPIDLRGVQSFRLQNRQHEPTGFSIRIEMARVLKEVVGRAHEGGLVVPAYLTSLSWRLTLLNFLLDWVASADSTLLDVTQRQSDPKTPHRKTEGAGDKAERDDAADRRSRATISDAASTLTSSLAAAGEFLHDFEVVSVAAVKLLGTFSAVPQNLLPPTVRDAESLVAEGRTCLQRYLMTLTRRLERPEGRETPNGTQIGYEEAVFALTEIMASNPFTAMPVFVNMTMTRSEKGLDVAPYIEVLSQALSPSFSKRVAAAKETSPDTDNPAQALYCALLQPPYDVIVAIMQCQDQASLQSTCRDIVAVAPLDAALAIARRLLITEIASTDDLSTVFRANTMATLFVSELLTFHCHGWVSSILSPLIPIVAGLSDVAISESVQRHSAQDGADEARNNLNSVQYCRELAESDIEIDPRLIAGFKNSSAAGNLVTLTANSDALGKLADLVLSRIEDSIREPVSSPSAPPFVLYHLCSYSRHLLTDFLSHKGLTWTDSQMLRSSASLLFLRLMCPAVSVPSSYNIRGDLQQDLMKAPSRRRLLLVAKVLQALANGAVVGSKEPWMKQMRVWIGQRHERMSGLLTAISLPQYFHAKPDISRSPTALRLPPNLAPLVSLFQSCKDIMTQITTVSHQCFVDQGVPKEGDIGTQPGATVRDPIEQLSAVVCAIKNSSGPLVDTIDTPRITVARSPSTDSVLPVSEKFRLILSQVDSALLDSVSSLGIFREVPQELVGDAQPRLFLWTVRHQTSVDSFALQAFVVHTLSQVWGEPWCVVFDCVCASETGFQKTTWWERLVGAFPDSALQNNTGIYVLGPSSSLSHSAPVQQRLHEKFNGALHAYLSLQAFVEAFPHAKSFLDADTVQLLGDGADDGKERTFTQLQLVPPSFIKAKQRACTLRITPLALHLQLESSLFGHETAIDVVPLTAISNPHMSARTGSRRGDASPQALVVCGVKIAQCSLRKGFYSQISDSIGDISFATSGSHALAIVTALRAAISSVDASLCRPGQFEDSELVRIFGEQNIELVHRDELVARLLVLAFAHLSSDRLVRQYALRLLTQVSLVFSLEKTAMETWVAASFQTQSMTLLGDESLPGFRLFSEFLRGHVDTGLPSLEAGMNQVSHLARSTVGAIPLELCIDLVTGIITRQLECGTMTESPVVEALFGTLEPWLVQAARDENPVLERAVKALLTGMSGGAANPAFLSWLRTYVWYPLSSVAAVRVAEIVCDSLCERAAPSNGVLSQEGLRRFIESGEEIVCAMAGIDGRFAVAVSRANKRADVGNVILARLLELLHRCAATTRISESSLFPAIYVLTCVVSRLLSSQLIDLSEVLPEVVFVAVCLTGIESLPHLQQRLLQLLGCLLRSSVALAAQTLGMSSFTADRDRPALSTRATDAFRRLSLLGSSLEESDTASQRLATALATEICFDAIDFYYVSAGGAAIAVYERLGHLLHSLVLNPQAPLPLCAGLESFSVHNDCCDPLLASEIRMRCTTALGTLVRRSGSSSREIGLISSLLCLWVESECAETRLVLTPLASRSPSPSISLERRPTFEGGPLNHSFSAALLSSVADIAACPGTCDSSLLQCLFWLSVGVSQASDTERRSAALSLLLASSRSLLPYATATREHSLFALLSQHSPALMPVATSIKQLLSVSFKDFGFCLASALIPSLLSHTPSEHALAVSVCLEMAELECARPIGEWIGLLVAAIYAEPGSETSARVAGLLTRAGVLDEGAPFRPDALCGLCIQQALLLATSFITYPGAPTTIQCHICTVIQCMIQSGSVDASSANSPLDVLMWPLQCLIRQYSHNPTAVNSAVELSAQIQTRRNSSGKPLSNPVAFSRKCVSAAASCSRTLVYEPSSLSPSVVRNIEAALNMGLGGLLFAARPSDSLLPQLADSIKIYLQCL